MNASSLSTISKFGKFITKDQKINSQTKIVKLIELKQNFSHQKPLTLCKFDMAGNKIYLIDSSGTLIGLNLVDNTISTLKDSKIQHFAIDGKTNNQLYIGNNSYHILLVNKKSQLLRVHFESKRCTKIMNLNLSRIITFQRNYLRQLLLVLDYKILMLYDLTNSSKIRSLKANNQEIFTNASFASNNRFLILSVKNIQIRILQILNFNIIHKIRLPFQIEELKIQISYDCKKISIYGKCHIIFFISFNQQLQLSYQLVQLPNIKAIKQLKYTYQGEIILLTNDQIIYAISPYYLNRLIPIFNMQQKIRLMGFDLSIDTKSMVVVSNRSVFSINWKGGLKKIIKNSQTFKLIQIVQNFQQNKNNQINQMNNQNYQYDEQEQQQQLKINSKGQTIINQNQQIIKKQNFNNSNVINQIQQQPQFQLKYGVKNLNIQKKQQDLQDLIIKQDRIRKQLINLYTQKDRI